MNKSGKITLLIFSLLPFIDCILLATIVGVNVHTKHPFFIILTAMWILLIPIQWIFYINNVFRNSTIAKDQRVLWIVLLLGVNILIFPIYWYFHIWRDTNKVQEVEITPITSYPIVQDKATEFKGKLVKITLLLIIFLPIIFGVTAAIIRLNGHQNVSFSIFSGLTYLSLIGLVVFYVVNAYRNNSVAKNQRTLWTILLVAGNILIFPFYWYNHIWCVPKTVRLTKSSHSPPTIH